MSSAQRAAAFKKRMQAQGLRQVNVWVPVDKMAQIQILAEMMRDDDEIGVGPARNERTGKLVRIAA